MDTGAISNQIAAETVAQRAQDGRDVKRLRGACQDFESVFVQQMLAGMRQTVPESGLLGNSSGEHIFQDLMDQQLSKNVAQAGGLGIGDLLFRELGAAPNGERSGQLHSSGEALTAAQGRAPGTRGDQGHEDR